MLPTTLSDEERRAGMERGQRAFERGEFYEAHEIWEVVWNAVKGPERIWIQALIQISAAHYQLERGRPDPCARLLRRALAKLDGCPAAIHGVDLRAARDGAERTLRETGVAG